MRGFLEGHRAIARPSSVDEVSSLLPWLAAVTPFARANPLQERDIQLFEERFINSLNNSLGNDTVKLVGFKTVQIPSHEPDDLNAHYDNNPHEWGQMSNYFYDRGSGTLRVYFPVEGALVAHDGARHEANALGELKLQQVNGDYAALCRKQTDRATGVEGNRHHLGWYHLPRPGPAAPDAVRLRFRGEGDFGP
ncbi:uncharacterized protein LDX57_012077 [Aspergillus melleus]|uniref:uncharacterized protein n=1 Tax=Aspergillus melleus TaxID=138277 RepID=UPI001E8E049E|nr:uncharacterized protein LDX57_012077 [Aspergillus melleus]KAH8434430.1 hypothetical protein LDX57_012077 [Aspergillus melleus]